MYNLTMTNSVDGSPDELLRLAFGDDELVGLAAIRQLRGDLDDREGVLVSSARVRRRTWSEIGEAIGTTRQGAYNRFGDFVKRELVHDPGPAGD